MTFWNRFLEECNRKEMKPNPVANEIGISSATITKWRNGAVPSTALLNKAASYFEVSVEYLIGNTNTRSPLDQSLDGIDFALAGEIRELTEEEKQDVLDYIRFKKSKGR